MAVNASSILDRSAHLYAHRLATVGDGLALTYRELADRTYRAGRLLCDIGCGRGDRVLIALADLHDFITALFGTWKASAIPVPVSPLAGAADYAHYFAEISPVAAIVDAAATANLPSGTYKTIIAGDDAERHLSWKTLLEQSPASPLPPVHADPSEVALLLYTSGSTSRQKCVMHSHQTIVNACRNIAHNVFQVKPSDRVLSIPKPFFSWGLGGGVLFPLYSGAACITGGGRLELKQAVDLIRTHRPTTLVAIPAFLSILLEARSWMDIDLSPVRQILSAGEPLSPTLFEAFRSEYGIDVFDGIGSTEMFTHFISNRPGHCYAGTCGVEVPGYEVMLANDDGIPTPDGQLGRLMVKGPTAFLGYWRNPEATARVRKAEWVQTGDIMYRDSGGNYHYCGRSDDMLKVSGVWVLPGDVESILCQHEDVSEAIVTAREDDTGRRRLVAYIVPRPESAPAVSELLQFVGSRAPLHMIPSAFVTLDAVPRTPNGKLNRSALPGPNWGPARQRQTV